MRRRLYNSRLMQFGNDGWARLPVYGPVAYCVWGWGPIAIGVHYDTWRIKLNQEVGRYLGHRAPTDEINEAPKMRRSADFDQYLRFVDIS